MSIFSSLFLSQHTPLHRACLQARLLTEMLKNQLILLFFVLINSCVYCQLYQGHAEEESIHANQRLSPKGYFGNKWRRQVLGGDSEVPIITNNTVASTSLAGKSSADSEHVVTRDGKFFSLFTVVKFANDDCTTAANENGTCYSASECSSRGGVSSGSCAGGFGVCCTFSYTCGQTTYQNSSYFSNLNYPSSYDSTGSCQLTVNKVSSNVCQLRLDFFVMVLIQPETNDSNCNRDQFIVTGGSRVPAICGTNNGQHMYIETGLLGNSPITLTVVTSGTGFARQWRIKMTQMNCDSIGRAPNGCLQYYTGVSGTIRSFNYDGTSGRQLSNQDYSICIRTESNFCSIAYSVCSGGVYSITGPTGGSATAQGTPIGALVGATTCNTDWLTIPCASDNGRAIQRGNTVCQDRLCGDAFASVVQATSGTVITSVRPFQVTVHFDAFEAIVPTSLTNVQGQFNNRGFCLSYIQQPCTS
ncbi:uncharacterized protein LOC116917041 [Daphnia magna]|uniref:uncharacterized protein LOC116917041 n=1 Tax=Daphnia magna TaxID=35525 RepID=UPI001E1BD560|nr:uncharacterized protein LOC116917041 [Daphnia magna]